MATRWLINKSNICGHTGKLKKIGKQQLERQSSEFERQNPLIDLLLPTAAQHFARN